MDKFSIEAVMPHLEPYLETIDGIIRDGFATLWQYDPRHLADYDETAAAKNIHRHQLMLARKRLGPLPGINIIVKSALEVVNIKDQVCLRWKKVNGAGRGRNIDTQQQRNFDAQLSIPGLPDEARRVVAGYKPDASGTKIEKILIALPMGASMHWTVQIILSSSRKWEDITPLRLPGTEAFKRPERREASSGNQEKP